MKENYVSLLGIVKKKPKISTKGKQALGGLRVIRGVRDVFDKLYKEKYDSPVIWTRNEELIEQMDKWEEGDAILVKGVIATKKVKRIADPCPECGTQNEVEGFLTYVNPIHFLKVGHFDDEKEQMDFLLDNKERSNEVQILCTAVREPKKFKTKTCITGCQYQVALNRKFRIEEDPPEIKSDYPWVTVYGPNADEDKKRIMVGSELYLDACLQARNTMKFGKCENCGAEIHWKNKSMAIVPYSVEYLTGYHTDEELAEMQEKEAQKAEDLIFGDTIPDEEISEENENFEE